MQHPISHRFFALPAALLVMLALPHHAVANDGRNRYDTGVPAELVHLHAPVSAQAGFRVLASDMPGGADGDPAFRWTTRPALALVRLASRRTVEALGAGPYPLAIFDLASENADTPIGFGPEGPRGRHPGGSHDGGHNLDLGYYLSSEQGRIETPDPAACTDHFRQGAPAGAAPVEDNICHGPADRLDTDRQTLFMLELVRWHSEHFAGELLEAIGIDAQVRLKVLARAGDWARSRRFGVTTARVAEMERLFASSPYEGWSHSHHHHIHVRLLPMHAGGRHAARIAALVAQDRALEARLLTQPGAESGAAADGCALVTELSSQALTRSLDLQIVGTEPRCALAGAGKPQPAGAGLKRLRFRIDGGEWSAPEDPLSPMHHVVDAPAGTAFSTLVAEAELTFADGHLRLLKRTVAMPAQPGWLRVRIDASHFVGRARTEGNELLLALDFPPVDATLIDHIAFLVHRRGVAAPERVVVDVRTAAAKVQEAGSVEAVEAEVGLSRRMRLRVPVVVR
ncbi:MAG TPA: hypothetical protein VFY73_16175 [Ideonella sp.]|uniref:hypothetical protein n=1 Tax=Ideonella sp. TaxID=1929293 RepID=UPI002E367E68|nr:hypothetical protein [Ideonella sp.]HEX5685558.1 hypothetical protein [Ideonella sp.]